MGRRERGEMWCNVPLTMDAGNGTTREGGDVVDDARGGRCGVTYP